MYHDEAELTQALDAFLHDAAAAEEPVLVALSADRLTQVRESVDDVELQARFEDIREVGRNPSRLLAMMEGWVERHDGPTRIVSEAIWPGRSYAETVECLRHEALLNEVLAESTATVLCPYDAEHLDAETLAGVEFTHPIVTEAGERRASRTYREPVAAEVGDRWPLEPASEPIHEHELGSSLGEMRQAVADDPLVSSLSGDQISDLIMAVNEAATNAIRHGDGNCTARIWHDGHGVVTEMSSASSATDPLAGRRPQPEPEALSGRGLWLINQVCDLVELRTGDEGMTLRMHMRDAV